MSETPPLFVPRFRVPRFVTLDLLLKLGSLVFAILVTWVFFQSYVWPTVAEITVQGRVEARMNEGYVGSRALAIIVKDPEQFAEIVAWIWAMLLLAIKLRRLALENRMMGLDYLGLSPGEQVVREDALRRLNDVETALGEKPQWRERILPNVILSALHRFHITGSVPDAAQSVRERSDVTASEFEADLALVRFIAWAIPAIGFIGTVRGIGQALSKAGLAIQGDITGVVDALGLAFNSTLVALVICIPLMFLLFLVQGWQDKLFVDLQGYCDAHLIARMKAPEGGTTNSEAADAPSGRLPAAQPASVPALG
jgi:biopolymer transport protein ExbB/TolQ